MAFLAGLAVADPPRLWSELGFSVQGERAQIGAVAFRLGAEGRGVTAWTLAAAEAGPTGAGPVGSLDGLETDLVDQPPDAGSDQVHPNGVVSLDHLVVSTPDLERTVGVLAGHGLIERRRRDAGRPGGRETTQVFFRLGEAILELVGPADRAEEGPARFWGLAFTVADLEQTAGFLGGRLRDRKEAVQPGRSIASLDRAAGSTLEMAFMTPAAQAR